MTIGAQGDLGQISTTRPPTIMEEFHNATSGIGGLLTGVGALEAKVAKSKELQVLADSSSTLAQELGTKFGWSPETIRSVAAIGAKNPAIFSSVAGLQQKATTEGDISTLTNAAVPTNTGISSSSSSGMAPATPIGGSSTSSGSQPITSSSSGMLSNAPLKTPVGSSSAGGFPYDPNSIGFAGEQPPQNNVGGGLAGALGNIFSSNDPNVLKAGVSTTLNKPEAISAVEKVVTLSPKLEGLNLENQIKDQELKYNDEKNPLAKQLLLDNLDSNKVNLALKKMEISEKAGKANIYDPKKTMQRLENNPYLEGLISSLGDNARDERIPLEQRKKFSSALSFIVKGIGTGHLDEDVAQRLAEKLLGTQPVAQQQAPNMNVLGGALDFLKQHLGGGGNAQIINRQPQMSGSGVNVDNLINQ